MNGWVVACIAVIVVAVAYSYMKQISFSIIASVCCVAVLAISFAPDTFSSLAFRPQDLVDPERAYTVLTSMFSHSQGFMGHIFFNVMVLALIGFMFEQRIGTRPFMIIYMLAGVCGTLTFAALRWDAAVAVVGASGAISGILGAFVRMYPNERMMFLFLPFGSIPAWMVIAFFLMLQLVFVAGPTNIAVEAHIGGLVAGMLAAPYVARMPLHRRVKKMISLNALRRLARTAELKAILRRIENEEIPDVRSAWIEEFLSKARCPHCGAPIKMTRESITCKRGHLL
ncbi:MAG: rhomboid family intramembrane serine protease [Methanobacteriota archaeon]|nr:MAG: rhomboid family intramembrane serine protease [Euryarchaeota archaeon]